MRFSLQLRMHTCFPYPFVALLFLLSNCLQILYFSLSCLWSFPGPRLDTWLSYSPFCPQISQAAPCAQPYVLDLSPGHGVLPVSGPLLLMIKSSNPSRVQKLFLMLSGIRLQVNQAHSVFLSVSLFGFLALLNFSQRAKLTSPKAPSCFSIHTDLWLSDLLYNQWWWALPMLFLFLECFSFCFSFSVL